MTAPRFKSAYLIYGDNHQRIIERRSRLHQLAEKQSGIGNVDLLDGDQTTPDGIAQILLTPTLLVERRFVLVDGGVQKWRAAELDGLLEVLGQLDKEVTVAFFAYEQGRAKVSKKLVDAIHAAGGDVAQEKTPNAASLPAFVVQEAKRLGVGITSEAVRELIDRIGSHPARFTRELEKLKVARRGEQVDLQTIQQFSPLGGDVSLWTFIDAVLVRNQQLALQTLSLLFGRGEQPEALLPPLIRRLLDAQLLVNSLQAGMTPAALKQTLKMPPWLADRRLKEANQLRKDHWVDDALQCIATVESATRGSSLLSAQTEVTVAVAQITA